MSGLVVSINVIYNSEMGFLNCYQSRKKTSGGHIDKLISASGRMLGHCARFHGTEVARY